MWAMIAVWFITTVLGELLKPKVKPPKNNSQLEFPDNRQDRKIPLFAGTVQLRGPLLAWWGDVKKKPIKKKVKSGLFSSTTTIVGYRYYGAMQLVLGHGEIDAVKALHFARKSAWTGSVADGAIAINLPELFGDKEAEGGVAGTLYVHGGDSAQAADSYLTAKLGVVPAHGGVAYCVWSNPERTGGGYLGNSNSPPEIWITVQRLPRLLASGKHDIGGHANPAEFLYEMHVSQDWGAGLGTDQVDTASFLAAATTLYDEGLGIAPLYADATDVDAICLDVLEHIDGALYSDIFTGKRVLVLARADYTVGSLQVFDESNSVLTDYSHGAWDETINEVHVSFTDAATGEQNSVVAQDLANQQIQQAVVARTIDYPACPTPALAQKLAWRDLRALSLPLAKATIRADRSAWVLRPGSVVKLDNALLGVSGLVMRVNRINYGTLVDGQIEFECVQDVFSMGATIYGALPATGWSDPTTAPAAALYELLMEAPYHLVRADPDTSADEVGKLLTWAAAPSGDSFQYQIHTRQGSDSYVQRGSAPFGATATLAANLTAGATSLTVTGLLDGELLEATDATGQAAGENLIRIDNEWISWRTKTDAGGGVWTLTNLYRGVLDTVPALHAAATRVRFLSDAMGTTPDEYALTASVDAKYLPQTGRGTLPLASATNLPITLTQRVSRPYPPANVRVNTTSYPDYLKGAYQLDWYHRDRTQQLTVIPQSSASIGPEASATYTLRLYGETNTLLRTETGLTGLTYTWSAEEADSGLTIQGSAPTTTYDAEVAADSPVARWRLDEASGTTANDSIGTNNGTYAGATLNQSPLITSGTSVLLSGSSSGIDVPDAENLSFVSTAFTMEGWIKTTQTTAGAVLCKDTTGSVWGEYQFETNTTGTLFCTIRSGNADTPNVTATTSVTVNDGVKHHIVAVFTPSATLKIYVDGVERASASHTLTTSFNSAATLRLGRNAGGNYLVGNLDEVALYATALSAARVQAHYNSGAAGVGANLPRINNRARCELETVRSALASHQKHDITTIRVGYGYSYGYSYGGL